MGVIVTGMHRSGTSMVAAWTAALGVPMAPGEPFPVDPANSEGLFELQEVVAFNDEWLGILGGSWWAPPPVRAQTWRSVDGSALEEARGRLEMLRGSTDRWFVKDPRISLLLPLWDRLALRRQPVALSVRDHREVAMSLHVRNGTSLRRALALWWHYNNELVTHLYSRPTVLLDFASSLADPAGAVQALAQLIQGERFDVTPDSQDAAAATVRPSLKRQRITRLDGTAERLARDLDEHLAILQGAHGGEVPRTLPPAPDWTREALDELTEFWSMVVERDIALAQAQQPGVGRRLARRLSGKG